VQPPQPDQAVPADSTFAAIVLSLASDAAGLKANQRNDYRRGITMKRFLAAMLFVLPALSSAAEYQSTLLVQTGQMRESDLIIRTISDLESNRICLTFYIATAGTSPAMTCYNGVSGFRSSIRQVGHFQEGELVVRKIKDSINNLSCIVGYVTTPGTSPAISCYQSGGAGKDDMQRGAHLREGDLDIFSIVDPDHTETCLVAYVRTKGTAPNLTCYESQAGAKSIMDQTNYLREGDLVVRKIIDRGNRKECLVAYVSTEGTSPHIFCSDISAGSNQSALPPAPAKPAAPAAAAAAAPAQAQRPTFKP